MVTNIKKQIFEVKIIEYNSMLLLLLYTYSTIFFFF